MDTIRIGRISAINYTDGTARIVYTDRDNAVTPELPAAVCRILYAEGG